MRLSYKLNDQRNTQPNVVEFLCAKLRKNRLINRNMKNLYNRGFFDVLFQQGGEC